MMNEIGSEFMMNSSFTGNNEFISLADYPKRYVLSGRTGLYLIAEELSVLAISSIALPAYCCGSMIAPFVDHGFSVSFYDEKKLFTEESVLIMDYFGFVSDETARVAEKCKAQGIKIIVDATQTAFSRSKAYDFADYIVVSYRKWFDCLCTAVYSREGFKTPEYEKEATAYLALWREAAIKKRYYIDNGIGEKQSFLNLYSKANSMLEDDYIGYKASQKEIERLENVDSNFIMQKRRSNALILLNDLKGIIDFLFDDLNEDDCPLHVPVLLPPNKRAQIRSELIQKSIYCPCHWPIDKKYPYEKTALHDEELSLICDQRYTEEDMKREAAIIKGFFEER